MEIDWDLMQPLRLALGAHEVGSGYGCAMQVVSHVTGDVTITDYPACANDRLSRMVQMVNDRMAVYRGYYERSSADDNPKVLNPEDAVRAIRLGFMTIGTADIDRAIVNDVVQQVAKRLNLRGWFTPFDLIEELFHKHHDVDLIADVAEEILTEVRKAAGLDAVEEVTIPAEVLL